MLCFVGQNQGSEGIRPEKRGLSGEDHTGVGEDNSKKVTRLTCNDCGSIGGEGGIGAPPDASCAPFYRNRGPRSLPNLGKICGNE